MQLLPRAARQRLRRLRNDLRFAWKRRRLRASVTIRVAVLSNWGDIGPALELMTPAGSGRFGRVHFALRHAEEAHYTLVLTRVRGGRPAVVPARRLWTMIGEPPIAENEAMYRAAAGSRVLGIAPPPAWSAGYLDHRPLPCPVRTWHVLRSYDVLRAEPLPADKPRRLSWITSDKAQHAGHHRRLAFLERLRGRVDFDLYGVGFRPILDKWEALAPYRYSIAFENSVFDDYFTEKIADPILAGALPLFFGCPNLERHLPAGAFLRFDPDDPLVFDRIAEWTASDLWRERRPALEEAKALLLDRYNLFRALADRFEEDFPQTF